MAFRRPVELNQCEAAPAVWCVYSSVWALWPSLVVGPRERRQCMLTCHVDAELEWPLRQPDAERVVTVRSHRKLPRRVADRGSPRLLIFPCFPPSTVVVVPPVGPLEAEGDRAMGRTLRPPRGTGLAWKLGIWVVEAQQKTREKATRKGDDRRRAVDARVGWLASRPVGWAAGWCRGWA